MAELLELLRAVPIFSDLPNDQIDWFLSQSKEMRLDAGETYVKQGDPADTMTVLLEGEFQWRGEFARWLHAIRRAREGDADQFRR